jgi:hypothetical protein
MGTISNLISVLVEPDVGSHFLHLLDKVEGLLFIDERSERVSPSG